MTPAEQKAVDNLNKKYFRTVSLLYADFMPDQLYHYTSTEGFFGIVSSGVFRASNFSYLNDSTEFKYGRKIACEVITEHLESIKSNVKSNLHLKVFSDAKSTLNDIGIDDIDIGLEFYLACFCTEADLLSQWRAYGSFCIGFNTEDLHANEIKINRVLYDHDEQKRKINRVIDSASEALAKGSSHDFLDRVHDLFISKVKSEFCFFKQRCFNEEKEWRAIHWHETTDQIEFNTSYGIIKPFIELWKSSKEVRLPITEVIVGPSYNSSLQKKSVKLLLDKYGYRDVEIAESSVPLRDLKP